MNTNDTDASERAVESAAERLVAAAASLRQRMRESTAGSGPASERYLDALDLSLRTAGELCHALTRLRDVIRSRVRR